MYKCVIQANNFSGSTQDYYIVSGWTNFVGKGDNTKISSYG